MPAAAVIPASVAYIKVVAVKKLVVGYRMGLGSPSTDGLQSPVFPSGRVLCVARRAMHPEPLP